MNYKNFKRTILRMGIPLFYYDKTNIEGLSSYDTLLTIFKEKKSFYYRKAERSTYLSDVWRKTAESYSNLINVTEHLKNDNY